MIVVADSSPLRYLILIEHTHVLPALYGRVLIPPAVSSELNRQRTPPRFALGWLEDRRGWKSALPNVLPPNSRPTWVRESGRHLHLLRSLRLTPCFSMIGPPALRLNAVI